MITEHQIKRAAYDYAYQNPLFGSESSFGAGARWAAEQMEAENKRLLDAIEVAVTKLLAGEEGRHSIRIELEKALEKL